MCGSDRMRRCPNYVGSYHDAGRVDSRGVQAPIFVYEARHRPRLCVAMGGGLARFSSLLLYAWRPRHDRGDLLGVNKCPSHRPTSQS